MEQRTPRSKLVERIVVHRAVGGGLEGGRMAPFPCSGSGGRHAASVSAGSLAPRRVNRLQLRGAG
ncbi:hypothetical protein E2562_007906 [Oryza meyeriana var. granulata]|uniref:Uncharacterized protein n=1 Tax=Oryza meyeriana var. granulata TaxID=110450 RepID=A0A6G1DWQ0_9ORYZ|nr:hypothetical protein E2562_007906 [Oryza meyeriana var. granulata]